LGSFDLDHRTTWILKDGHNDAPMQCMVVHEEHDEVRRRAPNLVSHAPTFNGDEHRSAPSVYGATGCHSTTIAASKDEARLYIPWNNGNTLCRLQQVMWNGLIWRIHNLLEDLGGLADSACILLTVGRNCDLSRK
jgi:hypothetical protein